MNSNIETRAINSKWEWSESRGNTLTGYASVFNVPAEIYEPKRGVFTEIVLPGSFRNALNSGGDIIATYNHSDRLLGRTAANTLRLQEDSHGLRMEIDLPDSAGDIKELVKRGDLFGASISFAPRKGGEKWDGSTRTLSDLYLIELGPVINPAQPATELALRSLAFQGGDISETMRLRLALAEKIAAMTR